MNSFLFSLAMLRRDWRAGEWRVLLLALLLAIGSLATVGLFADRVRLALDQQTHQLIGADLRITSTRPFDPGLRATAAARGLQTVQTRSFPSMVAGREQVLLSEIQAVEPGYPLRGKIEIDDGSQHQATAIPSHGTVWADERLLRRLDLRLGDELRIGAKRFTLAARIVRDIDPAFGFASLAPRVLMNEADLPATGLLQEGSRLTYRLLVAGEAAQVQAFRAEIEPRLGAHEKIEDVRDARPEIRIVLARAEHFLNLAALTAAILAGIALALAARRFVMRHLDGCAVLRCLGAQQSQILRLFLYQFILIGCLAGVLGGLLGYAAQALLVESISALREAGLPQPGVLPLLKAAASGFVLLLGFAFMPLLQLRRVPPLRVLRREIGLPPASNWLLYSLALGTLAALFLWYAGSLQLGLTVLAGLLAGLLWFGVLAWLLLRGLSQLGVRLPAQWRHVFNNLARHSHSAAIQIVAFSLGGMALLLLTLVRSDLMQSWQDKLPPDAPNRFILNIQPDQRQAVSEFFVRQGLSSPQLLPMVRGRLVAINNRAISGDDYADMRARRLVEREFNLSYMTELPPWNTLAGGTWWQVDSTDELSVEEGVAATLGIRIGDTLTYDVAGSRLSGRVSNLRKVEWDSMKVNFFVIATPPLLQDFPATYIASFYLPPKQARAGDELVRAFPNLLLIDTGAVIEQVRNIMDQIAQLVGALFAFTLLTGLVVLYAALLSTQDERCHEAAILRTLGADSRILRRLYHFEFAVLGAISGLFAAAGSMLLGWVLARFVLEIPWHFNTTIWAVGILGGMLIVSLSGWLATRRLLRQSPLRLLAAEL